MFENICCPLCGANDYSIEIPASYPVAECSLDFGILYHSSSDAQLMDQVVKCRSCLLVYVNPRLDPKIILESYSNAVDPVFVAQNEFRITTFKRSLSRLKRGVGLSPKKYKRILDIGCAGGAFLKAAQDLGYTALGVEPNKWLGEFGIMEYGVDIRQGTLQKQNFELQSFDVVTMWDILEHLTDPVPTLNLVHKLLTKDGLLIITYPDYGSVAARVLGRRWPFLLSVHLIYFTRATIASMLQRNGFYPIQFKPYWQTLELGYVLKRASSRIGFFDHLHRLIEIVWATRLPFHYQMGQTQVVAIKI